MLIDSGRNSFDLLDTSDGTQKRSFPTGTGCSYGRQVAFAECGEAVVGGSDHGVVYVFGLENGEVIDKLPHGDSGHLVQMIAVRRP